MEVNGPANIKMLLQMKSIKSTDSLGKEIYVIDKDTYDLILNQCDLTVKYMLAYSTALKNNLKLPMWHEIKDAHESVDLFT